MFATNFFPPEVVSNQVVSNLCSFLSTEAIQRARQKSDYEGEILAKRMGVKDGAWGLEGALDSSGEGVMLS